MNPITVLPDVEIEDCGEFSRIFLQQGIHSFQSACREVKAMPYGSNSDSTQSKLLFAENQGTCSTKHGAIAHLAKELNLPIHKNLGFYRLNDTIVTGVKDIIEPHGLDYIPQIHCFLGYENYRIDLTEGNCNGKNQTIDDYDFIVPVQPDPSSEEKLDCYLSTLRQYFEFAPELKAIGEEKVLELLEACDRQVTYQCSIMANKLQHA